MPVLQTSTIPKFKRQHFRRGPIVKFHRLNSEAFAESKHLLGTHDLVLPLTQASDAKASNLRHFTASDSQNTVERCLFVILFSREALASDRRDETLERVSRLDTLISSPAPIIVFLLNAGGSDGGHFTGFDAYMDLQVLLHTIPFHPRILPIPSPDQLLPLLQLYISSPTASSTSSTSSGHRFTANRRHALSLLHYVTATDQALSEHEAYVLGDLSDSIKGLAELSGSENGKRMLEEYLGEHVAEEIEAFWSEEWICD